MTADLENFKVDLNNTKRNRMHNTTLDNAVHLGTYKVIEFKGDNTNINRFVNENITTPQLHHDLETIWPWSQMFSLKKFSFRHQEQNLCANLLARKSISSPTNWRLYHSCRRFLTTFLNNDIGYED